MEARARVLLMRDGRATLACEDASSCGACGPGRGCGLRWLAGNGRRTIDVPVRPDDPVPLQSGETVTVSLADGDLLRIATRLYVPPLVGLLAGPLLLRGASYEGEGATVLAALAGLLLGWFLARGWVRAVPPRICVRRTGTAPPDA
jgi:sigma-E factor negative regulatory protein RseC